MNPITVWVLIKTGAFELGLSGAFYVGLVYGIPRLQKKAEEMWPHTRERWVHPNRIINFFWPTKFLGVKGWEKKAQPYHRYLKWWILDYYGQGFALMMLVLVSAILATSVGLINHTNLPYPIYYLFYARANGAPNGAHIDSYLSVSLLGIYAAYISRDGWFGAATTGFAYAIHEGLWLPLQYIAFWNYYNASVLINVARDVIFLGSISLMALAFWKYPLRRIPVKQFMWAILAYCGLLAAWFFLPPFLGNFPHLPITTINNPNLGLGIFQETPWYNALLPNFFEMAGWILLSVCMAVSLYQWKRVKLV